MNLNYAYLILGALLVANITVFFLVGTSKRISSAVGNAELKVSILNIGQGDSILIQGPTGRTMLVDGGPDRSVLADLGTELGPLNRHIDMLVETHPDADHITGFEYVFKEYSISQFMTPGIPDGTQVFTQIEKEADTVPGLKRITARRGMRIYLGGGAYADVLHPDRDMSRETETNDGSITMHVVYGKTSFMLTGDLPSPVEDWLIRLDSGDGELKTDVLKAGHHGSKYSTSSEWLSALDPAIVAISVGKNNRYGHPAPETLARIRQQGAKIIETENVGTIDFTSDGKTITEHDEGL
jgi:beta-lactamase superfamily II metal-dependent hydrolase